MGDSAQEELVSLIFGENPPDGWRDMPEFQIYLSELGQLSNNECRLDKNCILGLLQCEQKQLSQTISL